MTTAKKAKGTGPVFSTRRAPSPRTSQRASIDGQFSGNGKAGANFAYSLGTKTHDATPEQRAAPSFEAFAAYCLQDDARSTAKGKRYVCAPMDTGVVNTRGNWRIAAAAQPRRWIALDIDGCPPDQARALNKWAKQWRHFVYSTASDTAESRRLRFVFELADKASRDQGIAQGEWIAGELARVAPDAKVDPTTFRAEQPVYLPLVGATSRTRMNAPPMPLHADAAQVDASPSRAADGMVSPDAVALSAFTLADAAEVLAHLPTQWSESGAGKWYQVAGAMHLQFDGSDETYAVLDAWSREHDGYDAERNHARWRAGFGHDKGKSKVTTMRRLVRDARDAGAPFDADKLRAWGVEKAAAGLRMDSLYFMADAAKFVDIDTAHVYPTSGVDVLVPVSEWPLIGEGDDRKAIRPSVALRKHERAQWFDTQVYDPDHPQVIENWMSKQGAEGYVPKHGARMLNTYKKPTAFDGGDPAKAGKWLALVRGLYGSEAGELDHLLRWLAFAVRHPGKKINHALVLCGAQGVGKDSILHPIEALIGHANIQSIGADAVFGTFTTYRKGVLLKINEVRPTDSHTLTALYEKLKPTIAAPPTMLDVNDKHTPVRYIRNFVKVVLTTNHTDALHVPPDDRRLFVLDTDTLPGWKPLAWFAGFYKWCADGGIAHVKAYLDAIDLSEFDPMGPQPKTRAWRACVENRRTVGGDDACAVAVDVLTEDNGGSKPDVVFSHDLTSAVQRAGDDHATESRLQTLRNRPTAVRKLMLDLGYQDRPNPHNKQGRWTYTRRDRTKVTLGVAWVLEGVSAAAAGAECQKRQRGLSE